ncbi:RNA-binding S4 domain-containing protein [Cellulomonas bogoriensis]|uniref:tRNA synthetase RNA-binding protein n=1 Tax=Cellulomonas bogoriensis 69B4 = DSM 16987 TaxID=1386082 RepID=A0A0A0BYS2_9CELL|nr:S4 domain-containing protein [Cellulomonas bogoriensis]KGM12832.1 tRNA synthetase RNA-binding protein [Cellulomonas bogoriensis 69B4 = DSM 16987]
MSEGRVRVDAWTWGVRLFKTRSAAASACRAGHVRVNGDRAKPATLVGVGDEVRVRLHGVDRVLKVQGLLTKRVSAPLAAQACLDLTPPPPPREMAAPAGHRDRGTGRPTKRERREIERLRGRRP